MSLLVLTRKVQESIKIGDDVEITVVRLTGNNVRLAVKAPSHIKVVRSELPAKEHNWPYEITDEPDHSRISEVLGSTMTPLAERPAFGVTANKCTCHERDGSYACPYCRSLGIRGHMETEAGT